MRVLPVRYFCPTSITVFVIMFVIPDVAGEAMRRGFVMDGTANSVKNAT